MLYISITNDKYAIKLNTGHENYSYKVNTTL